MSELDPSKLLREGLLEGHSMLIAGAGPPAPAGSFASAIAAACQALGARVLSCAVLGEGPGVADQQESEEALERALKDGPVELLVVDGASIFTAGAHGTTGAQEEQRRALLRCMQVSWNATRMLAGRFIADGQGGRVLYLAPPVDAGAHAGAARAGLENLARTLSIEWARHAITTVAIGLAGATSASEVGALVAYLASPAGAYFSGCLLELS